MSVNLADSTVYPASVHLHDTVLAAIARLWHCPEPAPGCEFSGTGTVGSTEACLLAGLVLKKRWKKVRRHYSFRVREKWISSFTL